MTTENQIIFKIKSCEKCPFRHVGGYSGDDCWMDTDIRIIDITIRNEDCPLNDKDYIITKSDV